MNMKNLIQQLTDLESTQQLNEGMEECGDGAPAQEQAVTMQVHATGTSHVTDLINMMKNAGLSDAGEVSQDAMPMRQDIETFRGVVDATPGDDEMNDEPEMDMTMDLDTTAVESEHDDYEELDDFANSYSDDSDQSEYKDTSYMTRDLSGGLNREKGSYPAAQDGDNAMAADFRSKLESRLKEMMSDEQLDEISTDTLRSYKDKARKDAGEKHSELRKTREPHQMPQTDKEKELSRKSQDRYAQSDKANRKVSRREMDKPSKRKAAKRDDYAPFGRNPYSGKPYAE